MREVVGIQKDVLPIVSSLLNGNIDTYTSTKTTMPPRGRVGLHFNNSPLRLHCELGDIELLEYRHGASPREGCGGTPRVPRLLQRMCR